METQQLLPHGENTSDHFLYGISIEGVSECVGYLWFATMQRGSAKVAYVYQVMIKPAFRRRGYAKQAMSAVEKAAIAAGHTSMALNVFAQNTGARKLYESLGYGITNMNMARQLPPGDAYPSLEPIRSGMAPRPPGVQYHVALVGRGTTTPRAAQLKRQARAWT